MSIKLMALAWETSLPSTEKMVLLCLSDFANDDGSCWPSIATIVHKTSMGERTVQRAIKRLIQTGVLTKQERSGTSARYQIHPRHFDTPVKMTPPSICHDTPVKMTPHPRQNDTQTINEPSKNHQEGKSLVSDPHPVSGNDNSEKPLTVDEVVEAWNETAGSIGLRRCAKLTEDRRKRLRSLIRKYPIEDFQTALAAVRRSSFCRGENDRGWTADIEFFSRERNFVKLIEGSYDGKQAA